MNPELLAKLRDGLARYNEAHKAVHNAWLNEDKIVDEINHTLWSTLLPDAIKYLEGLVGHKIQHVEDDGDVVILSVQSLKFEKWEVHLVGKGVRYTARHSSPLSELSHVTVKYDSLNEVFGEIKVADTSAVEDLVACVEKMRAVRLEEATKEINDECDSVIASIRSAKEPKEAVSLAERFKPDPLHEITYFRWDELVREFGTEEDRKALEPVPVDVVEGL